jgi:hypothetical protein
MNVKLTSVLSMAILLAIAVASPAQKSAPSTVLQTAPPTKSAHVLRVAQATTDAFTPFIGKWIGFGCSVTGGSNISFRVEFSGTENAPYLRLREIARLRGRVLMGEDIKGKYVRTSEESAFAFKVVSKQVIQHWIFQLTDNEGLLKGWIMRPGSGSSRETILLLEPDNSQDLSKYLKANTSHCKFER